jgi:hypothetical protein
MDRRRGASKNRYAPIRNPNKSKLSIRKATFVPVGL